MSKNLSHVCFHCIQFHYSQVVYQCCPFSMHSLVASEFVVVSVNAEEMHLHTEYQIPYVQDLIHLQQNVTWVNQQAAHTTYQSTNNHLLAAQQQPYKKSLSTKNIREFLGKRSGEWISSRKMTRWKEQQDQGEEQEKRLDTGIKWHPWDSRQVQRNQDIPSLPSGECSKDTANISHSSYTHTHTQI